MVITLARKSKIEKSPHYHEIVNKLTAGESTRSVSNWLKKEYDEKISHTALATFYKKNISMEDKVEAELNRRAEEQKVNDAVDTIETVNETVTTVAQTIADNMQGVAKVASRLPEMFSNAVTEASDPNCNTSFKDVANICIQANKIFSDYFKHQDTNVEVNVNRDVTVNLLEKVKKKRCELNDLSSD